MTTPAHDLLAPPVTTAGWYHCQEGYCFIAWVNGRVQRIGDYYPTLAEGLGAQEKSDRALEAYDEARAAEAEQMLASVYGDR